MNLRYKLKKAFTEKHSLQRYIIRRYLFGIFESWGVHIVGNHFYEPIPATKEIRSFYREDLRMPAGHYANAKEWEAIFSDWINSFGSECLAEAQKFGYDPEGFFFRPADALVWYCLLRSRKPAVVIEVGQGDSTRIALAALSRNIRDTGSSPQFISIDPYDRLSETARNIPGLIFENKQDRIQNIDPQWLLEKLGNGGDSILFVDSSHVYKPGSDVEYLQREIYPSLPPGSLLHVHDILLPFRWPKEWLLGPHWFWNEQDFLEAFLTFNNELSTALPLYFLSKESSVFRQSVAELMQVDPDKVTGYSFYLERTKSALP